MHQQSDGSAIKPLVDDPDRFLVALNTVANEIKMSAWEAFGLFTGCSNSLWYKLIDEPELVGKILIGPAENNFWRNAEVCGAAQAHLLGLGNTLGLGEDPGSPDPE